MSWFILMLLGVFAGIVLSALVSAFETGSYTLNRVRLRVRQEQREHGARTLGALMERQDDLVITAMLGNSLADYIATACLTAMWLRLGTSNHEAEFYATIILTPLLLVFGGILPKDVMRQRADVLMYPLAGIAAGGVLLARATGLVWFLRTLTRAILRRVDPRSVDQNVPLLPRLDMQRMLQEGAAHGGLSGFQRSMIDRILNLAHVRVGQVMIPRSRTAMAPANMSRDEFLRIARMAHFSRIPVWKGDPRNVVGVVNVYDVITDSAQQPIAAHTRPPVTLRITDTVPAALLKLQVARQAMAIVTDAHNHCVGLLTIKDLAEEIIGEVEVW